MSNALVIRMQTIVSSVEEQKKKKKMLEATTGSHVSFPKDFPSAGSLVQRVIISKVHELGYQYC